MNEKIFDLDVLRKKRVDVDDLSHLHRFDTHQYQWSFSNDGRFLSILIGRPASKSFAQTNSYGSEANETDLYWVDLAEEEPTLKPVLENATNKDTFSTASWSADGQFLTFTKGSYQENPDNKGWFDQTAQTIVWKRKTGTSQQIKRSTTRLGLIGQKAIWVEPTSLLVEYHSGAFEYTPQRLQEASTDEASARFQGEQTATLYEETQTPPDAPGITGNNTLGHFQIGESATEHWSIPWQPYSHVLISPDGTLCLAQTTNEEGTAQLGLKSLNSSSITAKFLDTGDFTPSLDTASWCPQTGAIWALLNRHDGSRAKLLRCNVGENAFNPVDDMEFAALTPFVSNTLHVFPNGRVLLLAREYGSKCFPSAPNGQIGLVA